MDSVIAQDVYDALMEKGYRVFFSRISLEDKLGTEYEPYIFAALHSAKIMLAFGTDYEYYNAVWVKNEWSRYLQLMTKDKSKHLIPCYKGIDAYDMPKEFAKLQAQDMGKVGAMQDLLRGVDKIMGKGAGAAPAADTTAAPAPTVNPTVTSLLERAEMFLADGDWDNADTYCEKVLDMEPKNGTAYLYKLMAELHTRRQGELANQEQSFDGNSNYQKVQRFGDEALRGTLEGYTAHIKQRNEENRLNGLYTTARQRMDAALSEVNYKRAAEAFAAIPNYCDADKLRDTCLERAENVIYTSAQQRMSIAKNRADYEWAAELFSRILTYRNAGELHQQCLESAEVCRKDTIYNTADTIVQETPNSFNTLREAAKWLAGIPGWRDADELRAKYLKQADGLEAEEKRRMEGRLAAEKRANDVRIAAEKHAEMRTQWRTAGRCQHCGGEFKGLFTKKCVQCHKEKDY